MDSRDTATTSQDSETDRKAERIVRFASALWHGDRGSRGGFEAYMVEAKQIVDALPGPDCEDVIERS